MQLSAGSGATRGLLMKKIRGTVNDFCSWLKKGHLGPVFPQQINLPLI